MAKELKLKVVEAIQDDVNKGSAQKQVFGWPLFTGETK
jgi:hypothetical protein